MANTTSLKFPNLFDVSRNRMSIAEDNSSIVNRVRLMMLTDPTELYMNPSYGLGLKKYLFQYNNDNVLAIIQDKLIEQLRLWEPCVDADKTVVQRGLLISGSDNSDAQDHNHLKFTVILTTKYGQKLEVNIDE